MTIYLETLEDTDDWYAPSEEDERDFWCGTGHIEFRVIQNCPDIFEIEVLDYSGCAGGLNEGCGIDWWLTSEICLQEDPGITLREGCTYTIHDLTVQFTRGDGWTTDDDAEYEFDDITMNWELFPYLWHKLDMIWHRQVRCRFRSFFGR